MQLESSALERQETQVAKISNAASNEIPDSLQLLLKCLHSVIELGWHCDTLKMEPQAVVISAELFVLQSFPGLQNMGEEEDC